uniref:U6 snRNA-associated Sm-like protein LSm1 n=1 Tax=Zooxanthella nutricula TaxID=1333877 RepID=A0A6V0DY86_9DINO|mmetsp:Transcript_85040/g.259750  ORF Transcript_85040/g.259750 Transcript_85040/m.259750 type:complete len:144 (+) Transcript_85040:25-456(+)
MEKPVFDGSEAGDGARPASGLPHWASNLEDSVDKQLLIVLRDDRTLIGWLRTFDQFANLLIEHAVERHILVDERRYADIYLGTMMIRGENVCLFGEVDPESGDSHLQEAPLAYVLQREADAEAELAARGIQKPADVFAEPTEL